MIRPLSIQLIKFIASNSQLSIISETIFSSFDLLNIFIIGVDVSRFMQDDEYKRETILGIAM